MIGISSYSTTASENINANTGINWDEGMPPAAVNNSARQNMADTRSRWNDAAWFQYGIGSKTVAAVYASGTSFTLAGADATAYWHAGRRVKAVGSITGTIYGSVSSSSYATSTTTVNVVWDSGSLSNESLTIYAGTAQVTGAPVPSGGVAGTKTNDSAAAGVVGEFYESNVPLGGGASITSNTVTNITSLPLSAGDWIIYGSVALTPSGGAAITGINGWVATTSGTEPTAPSAGGQFLIGGGLSIQNNIIFPVGEIRVSSANSFTAYLTGKALFGSGAVVMFGYLAARRAR